MSRAKPAAPKAADTETAAAAAAAAAAGADPATQAPAAEADAEKHTLRVDQLPAQSHFQDPRVHGLLERVAVLETGLSEAFAEIEALKTAASGLPARAAAPAAAPAEPAPGAAEPVPEGVTVEDLALAVRRAGGVLDPAEVLVGDDGRPAAVMRDGVLVVVTVDGRKVEVRT